MTWPRTAATAATGRRGERVARRHLERLGYRTMLHNGRIAGVEVDLVMLAPDAHTIVLVEVKWRAHGGVGEALPQSTQRRRLTRAAEALRRRWPGHPVRGDALLILDAGERVEHRIGELAAASASG